MKSFSNINSIQQKLFLNLIKFIKLKKKITKI